MSTRSLTGLLTRCFSSLIFCIIPHFFPSFFGVDTITTFSSTTMPISINEPSSEATESFNVLLTTCFNGLGFRTVEA